MSAVLSRLVLVVALRLCRIRGLGRAIINFPCRELRGDCVVDVYRFVAVFGLLQGFYKLHTLFAFGQGQSSFCDHFSSSSDTSWLVVRRWYQKE